MIPIRELDAPGARIHVTELADLLIDAVAGGASVGFPSPLDPDDSKRYWSGVADSVEAGRYVLLVAGDPVVGTVQLHFAPFPTSRQLMQAVEQEAGRRGQTLLILDTQTGSDAERFYRKLGWVRAGEIPDFTFTPSGQLTSTTFYYKRLK